MFSAWPYILQSPLFLSLMAMMRMLLFYSHFFVITLFALSLIAFKISSVLDGFQFHYCLSVHLALA